MKKISAPCRDGRALRIYKNRKELHRKKYKIFSSALAYAQKV